DDQWQKKSPDKLSVGFPNRVAGGSPLKGKQIDKHRFASTKKNIVRRRILQPEAFLQRVLRQVEGEQAGGKEHLRRPFVWKTGKGDSLVFQHQTHLSPGHDFFPV